jgi:Zn-dependent protease
MIDKHWSLGRVAGLELSASPSALLGSLAIAGLLAVLLRRAGRTPSHTALVVAGAVPLHWSNDLWHHLGHAAAAQATGYPMSGVHFWGLLATSRYPEDEPLLPAEVHIRRALGGPAASLFAALLSALLWRLAPRVGPGRDLALVALAGNLTLGSGALIPLPFLDGGTLLKWWPRRTMG